MSARAMFSAGERWLLGAFALVAVGLTGALVLHSEIDGLKREFRLKAHNVSLQLSRRLAEGETLLTALHGFHRSGDGLGAEQFPSIARELFSQHRQIRWIGFAEYLRPQNVEAFERRMRVNGFVGFRVRPLTEPAHWNPSTERLPLLFLEPLEPRRARFLGADVLSRSAWREAVEEAVDSGEMHAIQSGGLTGDERGFLLLRATYRGLVEPRSVAERRRQVAGVLLVQLNTDALLAGLNVTDKPFDVALHGGDHPHGHAHEVSVEPSRLADGLLNLRMSTGFDLTLSDLEVHTLLSMTQAPNLANTLIAMALAAMLAASLIYGMRVQRVATLNERASFERAQLAEITLHSIGEAVLGVDHDGSVRYMNPVAERMTGHSTSEACGRPVEELVKLRTDTGRELVGKGVGEFEDTDGTFLLERLDRKPLPVACTLSPVTRVDGAEAGHVLVLRDISREHELSRELAFQARHDPLTELPNRREFERRLSWALAEAAQSDNVHTVCYVDLDQFKLVNDTCGHAAGDQMLRQIAGLLASELRDSDVLARLGGDEFGVLLIGCTVERAIPIAQRICETVAAFRFTWGERAFELGASIGVVEITSSSGTCDDVQRAADLACYAAKDTGRNRVHVYCQEDRIISRNHREMQWQVEIKNALEEGRFFLHAQPIRAVGDGRDPPELFELLLRPRNQAGETVPPMAFLPAAERYALMPLIDRRVIDLAFKYIANAPLAESVFTINLSGQSMADSKLGDFILESRTRTGIDASRVCFEVTETAAISHLGQAVRFMERLRAEGFSFALDDFGAGLSSFGYLKQLPLDYLKIDGQFVREIDTDPVARAMVSSIISVARVLELRTIAEMVENERSEQCLERLGVDYVQGFHVGRPRPLEPVLLVAQSA